MHAVDAAQEQNALLYDRLKSLLDSYCALRWHWKGAQPMTDGRLNEQDQRRACNARLTEISGAKSDIHHEIQNRVSERKRIQQQLSHIKAIAAKRIMVRPPPDAPCFFIL
jgi:hypothetical protein